MDSDFFDDLGWGWKGVEVGAGGRGIGTVLPWMNRTLKVMGTRKAMGADRLAERSQESQKRDTTGLTAENKELKLRLQALEQQAQLRDALNEALREEVQRLKEASGQIPAGNGNAFCWAIPRYPSHQPQPQPQSGNNSSNQPQTGQSQQSSTTSSQTMNGQPRPNFMDFNPRIQ